MQLTSMNLSNIRELLLEKCKINHESIDELARINLPVLTRLVLSTPQSKKMITRLGQLDAGRCQVLSFSVASLSFHSTIIR
jgi:hypothetical protein